MIHLIGTKEKLGIEFSILDNKNLTGNAKIWVGNAFFGTNEDVIFLKGYLLNGLKELLNARVIDSPIFQTFSNYKLKNIFYYLKHNLDCKKEAINTYPYLIHFGTFTDDYIVFAFSYQNSIYILWKIINKHSIFKDIQASKKGIHLFKTSKEELQVIISQLEIFLENQLKD
ncbi:hypothetical protein [Flavobacterium cerinum]|uniref:Uncharacterized protein n=1 Tax=Flavobacterium cerinum TaxID=2502784 RepID=A0ABY5ITZ4_9FLAO|nr:hypothetical protein [Flavobacterium cerinum]UUC44824.1 hypothetical protein NOX80_14455 [Flavobacterium cerinum]